MEKSERTVELLDRPGRNACRSLRRPNSRTVRRRVEPVGRRQAGSEPKTSCGTPARFVVPTDWNGDRILLHFGAVDWKADVWVNGVSVGSHTGGYTPFEFDITSALKKGANDIRVRVWDPTDDGYQPRGKQVNRPEGIWYTPVSGIWQTVWLEAVPQQYIKEVKTTPDLDRKSFRVEAPVWRRTA